MPEPCTVLISAPDLLGNLKKQATDVQGELLAFSDADALLAFEAITKRRPLVIALERDFAATPRGTALINRVKADPTLEATEIRLLSPDGHVQRLMPRAGRGPDGAAGGAEASPSAATATIPAAPLDQRGTRRAPRYRIALDVEVLLDGNAASLVDLSSMGAQVLSQTILRPTQRVRVAIADDVSSLRFNAAVAWALFEIPPESGPRYRAGLEFTDADAAAVDAFRTRHQA
jgi:hypothetical protein